jgi:drug/metabolite transporter (DMT)-like permease
MPSPLFGDPPCWLVGLGLLFAITMCSSAGVVFTILVNEMNVPPALCVSWRLAWVEIIQLLPFSVTIHGVKQRDKEKLQAVYRWEKEGTELANSVGIDDQTAISLEEAPLSLEEGPLMPRIFRAIPLVALSGCCLGAHFSAWVWSLQLTSLTHSFLWVSMGPIILTACAWVLFLSGSSKDAPTWMESSGTLVGFAGAVLMLGDIGNISSELSGRHPTIFGDFVALLGACAVSAYLVIGRELREWMPLWVYAFGVVGSAYMTSLLLATITGELTTSNVLGFLDLPYVWYALYLGVGPGIGGHTLLNGLLKYVSPLTISTAMLAEPLVGSVIGYVVGRQVMPGIYTWIGGLVLIGGLLLLFYGENEKRKRPCYGQVELT